MSRNLPGEWNLRGVFVWRAIGVLLLSLFVLTRMASPVQAVVSSPGPVELLLDPVTGRLYVNVAYESRILVMDVRSGQLMHEITGIGLPANVNEGTGIQALALDEQSGRLFAINSAARGPWGQDWTLFVVDAAQGMIVQQVLLEASLSRPYDQLHADPAHGKLYAIGEETTTIYDAATLEEQGILPGGRASLLDREGGRLYLLGDEKLVFINTADDTVLAELPLPEGTPDKMAVDPSRSRFYLAVEGAIHVLDTASQEWQEPLTNAPPSIQTLAVDPADGELYVVGPEEGDDLMSFRVTILAPGTEERKKSIVFQEPALPEGYSCGGYLWTIVHRLVVDPAGGRIYGSGNAMSHCEPEAHLVFVLDTEAEAVVEWLPRLMAAPETGAPGLGGDRLALPETGGQGAGGGWLALPATGGQITAGDWLVLAGFGLLSFGVLTRGLHSRLGAKD